MGAMTAQTSGRRRVLAGYAFALTAGALWGTTGTLSTPLYAEVDPTGVGFWRVLLAVAGFLAYGVFRRSLFNFDLRGLLIVGGIGGAIVAVFEVGYQFAISGVGVAGAATLLYLAPLLVTLLARPLLNEPVTLPRLGLGILVLIGVSLAVTGQTDAGGTLPPLFSGAWIGGVVGGLLSALAYSGSTLLARWAVPIYGALRVLFMQLIGGVAILAVLLPLMGHTPGPPSTTNGWILVLGLGLGSIFAANMFFFAGVRRIQAAPTAIAASIEPVVGAVLAFLVLSQGLTIAGWLGLLLVVLGVGGGYLETRQRDMPDRHEAEAEDRPAMAAGRSD